MGLAPETNLNQYAGVPAEAQEAAAVATELPPVENTPVELTPTGEIVGGSRDLPSDADAGAEGTAA